MKYNDYIMTFFRKKIISTDMRMERHEFKFFHLIHSTPFLFKPGIKFSVFLRNWLKL